MTTEVFTTHACPNCGDVHLPPSGSDQVSGRAFDHDPVVGKQRIVFASLGTWCIQCHDYHPEGYDPDWKSKSAYYNPDLR